MNVIHQIRRVASTTPHIRPASKWPVIVFLLTRAPRTVGELSMLADTKHDSVRRVLGKLHEEGLIRPGERRDRPPGSRGGRGSRQWEWDA